MEDTLTWEIDNFSERNDGIRTADFSSGGCEWLVCVYPKGQSGSDHLSLFLHVANCDSLMLGWKRRASYSLVLLNQSGKELFRTLEEKKCKLFCNEHQSWGYSEVLPLSKLQEKGFLEKDTLIMKIYIKVFEVVHQGKSTENEMLDFCGFQIPISQYTLLKETVLRKPDFAIDFETKKQVLKTKYRTVLRILKTLSKPPQSLSLAELGKAQSELNVLEEATGFKLEWFNSKIEQLSVECKKATLSDGSRVRELEDRVSSVELTLWDLKAELDKEKIKSAAASAAAAAAGAAAAAAGAAAAKVSSFQFLDIIIKRFFLSCFSFSK
ncbi:MATH domain and coiled-coil domain-containing protein [Raphanus sativus]|uniref:MATH domain and coiled-coil domain-containing protein At2g42460 n=1 Tax=Raphanus sativus TaxID=3726 RepID=A0A6J0P8X2_RAPSA|nr:MATH domain and coiled-coil domain-containing protein At2g42460 [Raphanus sativus]XP_018493127.1 MATH domain and coiled-coil domain-containing protein At2g42460 [Raphanus sativus]KAJ4895214.1 MATH domain and coiled-coil domain-containing protein [Raphanus sativus]